MFHRSERLLLRPVWTEDWQAIYGGIADEGVVRNLARAPWPYSKQDAREFVSLPIDPLCPKFLITLASDAQVIGSIGIDPTQARVNAVELGYWIARSHWGQGIATEAGRAVCEIASVLGYATVIASHFLDNPASGKVLQKIGFVPTGSVVARHSCGRGKEAMTAEYALDLTQRSFGALAIRGSVTSQLTAA